ncbi:MAG: lycopene cyclase domain-containing protein [Chthoniobacterales bacterium]
MESGSNSRSFQVVFAIAALLVIPAALTLRYIARFGYTWSLSLFLIPIAGLAWWFARRTDLQFPRAAFWRTIAVLAPLGFLLDLLFGNAFFVFPNKEATLGINIPAIGGPIPIEEFVFYLTGFILTLLSYVWCDEYWMAAYNVPDYKAAAKDIPRIVRFHLSSLVLGVGLMAAAIVYRRFFSGMPGGFPWYFIYLALASFVPSIGFLKTAEPFINWRAFSFTFFLILFISLLWEVTLALPYGWWEYRDEAMMGLKIGAWSNLPIEAPCVWIAVSFTTVIVYEVIKIWKALGTRALNAFFGVADRT